MTSSRKNALALLLLDTFAVFSVFLLVIWLRGAIVIDELLLTTLFIPLGVMVFTLYLIDGYNTRTDMMSLDYTSQHTLAMLATAVCTLIVTYVLIRGSFALTTSRMVILIGFAALIPVTLSYRRALYQRSVRRRGNRSLVFLGDRASCHIFREECANNRIGQPVVFCVVSEESIAPSVPADTELRPFSEVLADVAANRLQVEAIVLRETSRELQPDVAQKLVEFYFTGVPTYTLELFHQLYWRKIPLYRLNQTWLFQEGFKIAREPVYERMKRASDVVLSLLGLLLFAPFIICGAIAVWLEDRGPIFFRQTRIGRNHRPFRIVKLRTMRPTPSDAADPYTRADDPRVTRVGRFLRASRIDELPQLWNVLCGDMCMIGPRAEWDRLVADYEKQIPCYHFRHLVKPGITGWAQVNYPYGANLEDTQRKLEYDLYYIRHFSFVLDAAIVLKTIHIMLFGKGR